MAERKTNITVILGLSPETLKIPGRAEQAARVGRMVCEFISQYHTYDVSDEKNFNRVVIFAYDDLARLPFDNAGKVEIEDVMQIWPKAIIPKHN